MRVKLTIVQVVDMTDPELTKDDICDLLHDAFILDPQDEEHECANGELYIPRECLEWKCEEVKE